MKRLDRDSFHWPDTPDELQKVTLKEMHWLCDGLSLTPKGAFEERHPKIVCIKNGFVNSKKARNTRGYRYIFLHSKTLIFLE